MPCADGRQLCLEQLHQSYIYAGDLLGLVRHPQEYVTRVAEQARRQHRWVTAEPVVLPPRLLEFTRRAPQGSDLPPAHGVSLPRVAVIGLFTSDKPARDAAEIYSSLVVIWFQDRYGDAEPETLAQIASLDWAAHAFDWSP